MSGHVYVLGVSMPVPSQESEWPCLCVRGIDACTKSGMFMCWVASHVYVLGVSMPVPSQESEWPCLCVRGIDACTKSGKWVAMFMC